MASKIFRSTLFVAAVVLLCSLAIIMGFAYDYFDGVQSRQLKDELSLAVTATESQGLAYLQQVSPDRFRLTWIAADGAVLYDTQADELAMENHADRSEIRQALETGFGSSVRYSSTLMEKTAYEAQRLTDGSVLRISSSGVTMTTLVLGMLWPICVVIAIAIVLSAWLSHRMAKRIVEPLNRLDLEKPLENDAYPEIAPLLERINRQHLQISSQIRKLKRETDRFQKITENMTEALVLLDADGLVRSINPAAKRLFEASDFSIGKDFRTIDRNPEMGNAVNKAFLQGHGELQQTRQDREYHIAIDRICSNGTTVGAVILAFDVTEQLDAQRSRREFSANVSHELKTPLQTIIGSAELLENGLVRQDDVPEFVSRIRREASRLVDLVEDIIRLSRLDEGAPLPREEVALKPLAEEVAATLQSAAQSKDVTVALETSQCSVMGVRRLIYEMLYNLCDNAIKYNVPGGKVEVTVGAQKQGTVICVRDTGIGIPAAHQERIFERFYRVDKSHSRLSGGTGLGLSIVKHAAQYHGAKLALESEPGKGTQITVTFPG